MLVGLVKVNQRLGIVERLLLARFPLLLDIGQLGFVARRKVRIVVLHGPEMGCHVLCCRTHPRADRVIVVDALSYMRLAVGVVGGGGELVRVPEKVDVERRYQYGLLVHHELQEVQVARDGGWRQDIILVQRQDAVHKARLAKLSLRTLP